VTLPPGQHLIDGFPRFGGHLSRPAPAVPVDPRHRDPRGGHRSVRRATHHAGDASPERAHCRLSLRGWLVRHEPSLGGGLVATVYRTLIEPALPPETSVTHVVFRGLDGWRSIVSIGDALADDVLIAERLDGRPLDSDHGAPARLVSPKQYGYVSTKHVCRIEVHTGSQRAPTGPCSANCRCGCSAPIRRRGFGKRSVIATSPPWSVPRVYRATIAVGVHLSARGGRTARNRPQPR